MVAKSIRNSKTKDSEMEIIMLTVKNLEKDMKDIVDMMPAQYA